MCPVLWFRIYEPIMKHFLLQCTLFSMLACSEPFSVDRHDLIAPRIMGVRQQGEQVQVQIWNGNGLWHPERPMVEWLDASGQVLATDVTMTAGQNVPVMVRYTDLAGAAHEATFSLQGVDTDWTIERYDLGGVSDLSLDARLANPGTMIDSITSTSAMRIVVDDGSTIENARMRWMSAFGYGTFLERTAFETDFFQEDILMDRDEVEYRNPETFEYASIFALRVNGEGYNQWQWVDLWYSTADLVMVQGRQLYIRGEVPEADSGTLMAFEVSVVDADWGIELRNATIETANVESLPCAPNDGVFQLDWLSLGICTLSDIDGTQVVLEVD